MLLPCVCTALELYRDIFVILPASLVFVPHPKNANIMGWREYVYGRLAARSEPGVE